LSASAQKLAELLAVLGRPAEGVLLDRLLPDKDSRLAAQAELIRKQVAVETHNRLWLAHDWLGDKIRASMESSKRVSYHARIAAALRTLANCDLAERAIHQAEAGEWEEALEDALAAGEQDLAEGRPTALSGMLALAEQMVEKIGIAENDPRRWPYLALREGFYSFIERGPAWIRELDAMEQVARESDRPDWLLETLIRRGRAYRDLGRPDEAEKTLRQAAELAQSISSPGEAMARGLLAAVLDDRGATAEALLEAEQANRIAKEAADDITRFRTAGNLAYMQMRSGKVEEARQLMSDLLADPAIHKHPVVAARAIRQLGIIQIAARDYESGLDNLRQSVTHARSTGDLHTSLICQTSLVYELARFGLFVEAYPLGETTLELARGLQAKTQIGTLLNSLTSISFYRGDLDQAWSQAQASVAAAERAGLPEYVASCLGMLAAVALRRQRLNLARDAIKRAEQLLARVEHPTILTISHIAAQVWLESGERQLAARAAHQAIRQVVDVGIPAIATIGVLWEAAQVTAAVEGRPAAQPVYARAYQRLLDDMHCMQSVDLRRAFLNAFPAHRALLDFPYSGPRCLVELPTRGAPTGRPLHSDELVPVVWTLHAPGDLPLETTAGRRQRLERLCVEAVDQGAKATVDELAQALSVSPRTIQRDLQSLRRYGMRVETYGERSDQS
jgi:tetratricopeptide (TPR) repeat protein